MKRRIMKKSEVLKEGYINGLKKAQKIINEMLSENDDDEFELLDEDGRYSYAEINEWLDKNDANWDSFEQTDEGTLLEGDFFIYVTKVDRWLYAEERYLNEWSSCYKITYYDEYEDIPKELIDKAENYLDYINSRG